VKLIDLLNRNKREEYRALAKKYSGFPSAVTDSPR